MMEFSVPGRGNYRLQYLVLDLNGTVALDGEIVEGVEDRLNRLSQLLTISIVTADTQGSAQRLERKLKVPVHRIEHGSEDAQKLALVQQLGSRRTVSIGNGSNDVSMLRGAALGICILGKEGAAIEAMTSSDLVVSDINDALDLLLKPDRLVATLRK